MNTLSFETELPARGHFPKKEREINSTFQKLPDQFFNSGNINGSIVKVAAELGKIFHYEHSVKSY